MTSALIILQNVPWWVFVVFALLLYLGLQARQARTVSLRRLLITPAIFIGWGMVTLAQRASTAPLIALDWSLFAAGFALLTAMTTEMGAVRADRAQGLIHLPGSIRPLIRNLLIFGTKFAIAVVLARQPHWHDPLLWWDTAVSGAAAGYFLGWLARLALAYRQAPPLLAFAGPVR